MINRYVPIQILVMFVLGFITGPARADVVNVEFCVTYETDYFGSELSGPDDHLRDNDPVAARGVEIRLLINGLLYLSVFTPDDGVDRGCATMAVVEGVQYEIHVMRRSMVNGHLIELQTDSGGERWNSSTWTVPTGASSKAIDLTPSAYNNIMRAAEWVIHRGAGAVSGRDWEFRLGDCGDNVSWNYSCYGAGGEELLWIDNDGADEDDRSKYTIAHEMGHQIMDMANGLNGFVNDWGLDNPNCPSGNRHSWTGLEYQSAGAVEGFANFIAVRAFNHESSTDAWHPGEKDWDHGGESPTGLDETDWFSVESGPCRFPSGGCANGVDALDYGGDWCSTLAGRASEYDYARAFWDLHTDPGVEVPLTTMVEWIDKWNAHNWEGTASGNTYDMPDWRLMDAATEVDWDGATLYDVWEPIASDNGVTR